MSTTRCTEREGVGQGGLSRKQIGTIVYQDRGTEMERGVYQFVKGALIGLVIFWAIAITGALG